MPKLRLRITVPRPECTINMGNPDVEHRFGWEGISIKSDRNYVATIEDDAVFQVGGSTLFQTEEKWFQYATEMTHATEERLYLNSGQALIAYAGGGQGSHDEDEYDGSRANTFGRGLKSPISNTFIRLDLMSTLQTQAKRARVFLGGLSGGEAPPVPVESPAMASHGGRAHDSEAARGVPFLKKAAQLDMALGHITSEPTGNFTEQRRVTPEPPARGSADKYWNIMEERVNDGLGIAKTHDMLARFNPYSGPRGFIELLMDIIHKLELVVTSENVAAKLWKATSDAWKATLKAAQFVELYGQDDSWGDSIVDAAKDDVQADDAESRQATLESTRPPPWRLTGDGPWILDVSLNGALTHARTITAVPAQGDLSLGTATLPAHDVALSIAVNGGPPTVITVPTVTTMNDVLGALTARDTNGAPVLAGVQVSASAVEPGSIRVHLQTDRRGSSATLTVSVQPSDALTWTPAANNSDVADADAVTFEEVFGPLTHPETWEKVAEEEETVLELRSISTAAGTTIAASNRLADIIGITGMDRVDPLTDDAAAQKTFDNVPKAWEALVREAVEPIQRAFAILDEIGELAEKIDEGAKLFKGTEDPAPLGLLAKSGITLGTEDRIYGAASKGFYFVADGGTTELEPGDGVVPGLLWLMDKVDKYAAQWTLTREAPKPPSLGFVVRSDSDVDLKSDFFASLCSVGDESLVRIASGGATDITAKQGVAIGPRASGGQMEVFGHHIHVGVRESDRGSIWIKDHPYLRPTSPGAEGPPTPVHRPAWTSNAQKFTDTISLSAETTVVIDGGSYAVEVGNGGVKLGSRQASAGTPSTAWSPASPASPETEQTAGHHGARAVVTVSAATAKIEITDSGVTIQKGASRIDVTASTLTIQRGAATIQVSDTGIGIQDGPASIGIAQGGVITLMGTTINLNGVVMKNGTPL